MLKDNLATARPTSGTILAHARAVLEEFFLLNTIERPNATREGNHTLSML